MAEVKNHSSRKADQFTLRDLYEMGVKGMEERGFSDEEIHGWLNSPEALVFVNKRGDVHSALLEAGWDPDRYQKVLEKFMAESTLRGVFFETFTEKFTAIQQVNS